MSKSKKAKTQPNRTRTARPRLTARNADKHVLYQRSVQDPAVEVDFIEGTYRKIRDAAPIHVREDFCGTALFCAEWVKSKADRRATGVDIDPDVLAWGREHNTGPLGEDEGRVTLLCQDVRDPCPETYDVVVAFNFSYWIFMDRPSLRQYFETVRKSLNADGIFMLDSYGGWEAWQTLLERRPKGDFTYIWDQHEVNPIDHLATNYIHFEFKDGTRLNRAFEYRWRLWTLPELRELLLEAGFSAVDVYWDVSKSDDRTLYRPRKTAENQPGWLAYIVACP